MSSDKPTFPQSLVAYGSSPETSEDEDCEVLPCKDQKLTSITTEIAPINPMTNVRDGEDFECTSAPGNTGSDQDLRSCSPEEISDSTSFAPSSIEKPVDKPKHELSDLDLLDKIEANEEKEGNSTSHKETQPEIISASDVNVERNSGAGGITEGNVLEAQKSPDTTSDQSVCLVSKEINEQDPSKNIFDDSSHCKDAQIDLLQNIEVGEVQAFEAQESEQNLCKNTVTEELEPALENPRGIECGESVFSHEALKDTKTEELFDSHAEDKSTSDDGEPEILTNPISVSSLSSNEETKETKNLPEDSKQSLSSDKNLTSTPGRRRLRQIRHPSVKAAEAAADAAFVAAVTPTRKNLKEAKIACALAKVSDSAEATLLPKKSSNPQTALRMKKGRSSSLEQFANLDKEDSNSSEKTLPENVNVEEGKFTIISQEKKSGCEDKTEEDSESSQNKCASNIESEKPVGIKLKISRETVQILDPTISKLEVQIPTDSHESEIKSSPGGSKRARKLKEGTHSPIPPLSPITLKIAKSKEGLEVVPNESIVDPEVGKIEKITLKLSRDEGATIVKANVDEGSESRSEKLTVKLSKDEGSSAHKFSASQVPDDVEESKLEKITLKLSKGDGACIVKKRENDPSSSEIDTGKLERITLKLSNDNNVSIIRPKDAASPFERSMSASPEPGKIEKITLKVSKNDSVSIVKPASPTITTAGVEKLTLKVSKDGTAAVSSKHYDESSKDGESSKLEKITLKLSKDEGVSIIKPVSPVPDRKSKLVKDEPLSPLPPLIIARSEEAEPLKERITLKLSKAGGHPSPVGVVDERSSWSIKSTDSDTAPSPVTSDPSTPKSKPKRALSETPEAVPSSIKKLKLSEVEKSYDSDFTIVLESKKPEESGESALKSQEEMDTTVSSDQEPESVLEDPVITQNASNVESTVVCSSTDNITEVILLDSEDSQGCPSATNQESIPVIDIESEIPTSRIMRRKPRGRPRKTVLPPGAIPAGTPMNLEETSPPSKPKREKIRLEPAECDRPKRSCKGREKPPPKPAKPAKPRGKNALSKQKTEHSLQPEGPQLFEEETRMSADGGSQSQAPSISSVMPIAGNTTNGLIPKVIIPKLSSSQYPSLSTTPYETPATSPGPVTYNEESQGSISMVSSTTTESTPNRGNRKGRMEINVDPDAQAEFTVDMIAEYLWPLNDGHGETYMIQEQLSTYLGVKSFKRKYPNMQRRTVDHDERQYLLERRLVSESLCDLGLTAVPSHEVLDVLCTDFPEKYEEYRRHIREKIQRELSNKQKALLPGVNFGKEDSKSKAMRNMASFNAMFNRSRRDQRRCCFDLQSFTVHYPEQRRRQMTVPNLPRVGPYPLALVPGQYTDYYKEFTPTELRYFPLTTVLYGPLLPHEMMKSHATGGSDGSQTDSSDSSSSDSSSSDSDSSGSDSDSDSDSSSGSDDDTSNQTGTGTVDSQEMEVDRPDAVCRVCGGDRHKNKLGRAEPLVHCASCEKSGHLSCLDLTVDMFSHIRKYSWHCTDCKLCAQCNDTADEDKMLFCDMCDRGYHIYCVGLRKVPEGRWHCKECAICASCGARDPGGSEEHQGIMPPASQDTPTKSEPPQWQHEFKKGDQGARMYVRTLCVPCSKLWKKGRYCRLCWKCYSNQPEEEGLINCSICDRWMHADCCRKAGRVIDVEKVSSYICELCQQKGVRVIGNKTPSKVYR